jgi:UDP-2,4-diacetamido-2,4,6-trideoxy-beta-L-altropyranose hydrolase
MKNSNEANIIFWTEGGHGIGMGHVSRSLVIAGELRKRGVLCRFLINDDPAAKDRLTARGFSCELAGLDSGELSVGNTPGIIVFDTRKDISTLIKTLKSSGHKIVLLDNTTPARLVADTVIYPSPIYHDDLEWKGFKGSVYGGAPYVPVDETYLKAREKCRMLKHQPPYRILVTMGGSDPHQLTFTVVDSLLVSSYPLEIRAVIGPAFTPDPRLEKLEHENKPGLSFISGRDNLSTLMADSHLAVTAVGVTISELAVVGVPAILISNYAADREDLQKYRELGINLPLGFYRDIKPIDIQQAVSRFIQDTSMWQNMRKRGWKIIDGRGAGRIVDCLLAHL